MRVGVLGPVSVDGDANTLSPRDRVVLAALAAHPDATVSVEGLSRALWGADPPTSSRKVIQGCIARLRRTLGHTAIVTLPEGYRLAVAADDIDARRFDRLVRRGVELLALDEPERADHLLGEALGLWRGPPFTDLDGWDTGGIERERLDELRRDAEELRLDAQLRAGRRREVLAEAHRQVDAAPLRERRWALLARALYQAGRQSDALQTIHRARVMLSTELGLDPGPELTALQEQILRHDESLTAPAEAVEPSATCPYMGLVPYDVDDTEGFFGRTVAVDACLRRLRDQGVIVVVGPSGAGKSSLLRAGVVARLRHDGADVVVVTPGARPLDALTVLPSSGPAPVLVVDQCEEVVALCDDPAQRSAFLDALTDHADRAPLVVALRADWLGELSRHAAFARVVERGLYLLPLMGPDDLRAAIEGPASHAGLLVEPGLVDLLVRDVEHEPGALPLLSHALRTTWERREGRTLTVAGYTEAGGIRRAVAQTAEAVYDRVPPAQRPVLRDLLLRMVSQSDDGAPVRARLSRQLIADDAEHVRLVEMLIAERLITSDDEHIELAHEAVTRAWPRLQAWLTDDMIGQRILRHLTLAADTWEQMGRPDSELYRGVRLAQAVEWRDRTTPHLTGIERSFVDASVALAEAEQLETAERAARRARIDRRLRVLLAGVGVLSVIALGAGLLAIRQARRAGTAAVEADARRVGAQALAAEDIDTALLLAVEGVRLDDSPDTRANLLATLGRSPQLIGITRGEGDGEFGNISISGDGETIAVYDDANRLWFYDADTRQVRATIEIEGEDGTAAFVTGGATFHPQDGPVAASFSNLDERPVRLLDPVTFEEVPRQLDGFPPGDLLPWDAAFSSDGSRLAVVFDRYKHAAAIQDSLVVVWSLDTPDQALDVLTVPRYTHGLAFSPDGRQLYTGVDTRPLMSEQDPTITVYDVAQGAVDRQLSAPSYPFALSPDGTTLAAAAASAGSDVVVVDAESGQPRSRLRGHSGTVLDVAFSPDGSQVASSAADRSVILWDAATGAPLRSFLGHASAVPSVVFGPGASTLVSAGGDRALLWWDRSGTQQFTPLAVSSRPPRAGGAVTIIEPYALPSPDGSAVVYVRAALNAYDGLLTTVQVLDVRSGRMSDPVDTRHGSFAVGAWHPDGSRFATAGPDGFVRIWTLGDVELLHERRTGMGAATSVAYLGTGDQLVVAANDGIARILDAGTLDGVAPPYGIPGIPHGSGASWSYASSDGRTVALLTGDDRLGTIVGQATNVFAVENLLTLADVVDREVRAQLDLGFDAEWAAFSPSGDRVAITGRRGQVAVVDVAAGTLVRRPGIGHDGKVVSISYAGDGATIASGGADGRVSLWDGRTGALLSSITIGRPGTAAYVAFKPDGNTVSVATWDGEVYRLDVRVERWIAFACDVAGRNLTRAEWRETFGDRPYRETCS